MQSELAYQVEELLSKVGKDSSEIRFKFRFKGTRMYFTDLLARD